jgi:polysaccharide export outer membrane protein
MGDFMRRLIVVIFASMLLFGCNANYPTLPATPTGPYLLDSGDVLRVLVYNEPTISTDYSIGDDGTILMPIIGAIQCRGMTVANVQDAIKDSLASHNILKSPGVGVEVTQYRPFFVVGEVNKPGQYPYVEGLNALGAVAAAGGFTIRADENHLRIGRKQNGRTAEWLAPRLSQIRPGDVLIVPELFP